MIEGIIDFNHEHFQVPNMNDFLLIFNKQLIKRCIIVSQYDAECSFMNPINFVISNFFICLPAKCPHGQGEVGFKDRGREGGLKTGKNVWASFMGDPNLMGYSDLARLAKILWNRTIRYYLF